MKPWLDIPADSPFPLQNLPYGSFKRPSGDVHCGVAIGGHVLDLAVLSDAGLLPLLFKGNLNRFAAAGKKVWDEVRATAQRLLSDDEPRLRDDARLRETALLPMEHAAMLLPVEVGDYTDFYSSREHATNVGAMFRPEQPLMPNWLHLPVAYHGRTSSIVPSGTTIVRPQGQYRPGIEGPPVFGPTRALDYELEVAAVIGPGNAMGTPIPIGEAEDHIFGLALLNDWSARDIQAWEYQPLGPFLGKNFATSLSPWVVPLAALEPWRTEGPTQDPTPLPYLGQSGKTTFDLRLEVAINGTRVSASNFKHLYWSLRQQVAHHTVGGCPLRPGDLLASGTVSGPTPGSQGCLLELTKRGTLPITLGDGTQRRFLEDGDTVAMTAYCQGDSCRVGFGEVTGTVRSNADRTPSRSPPSRP